MHFQLSKFLLLEVSSAAEVKKGGVKSSSRSEDASRPVSLFAELRGNLGPALGQQERIRSAEKPSSEGHEELLATIVLSPNLQVPPLTVFADLVYSREISFKILPGCTLLCSPGLSSRGLRALLKWRSWEESPGTG